MRNLAAAGGMTDQHGILQIQQVQKFGIVIDILFHVVTVPGLTGPAMAAAVMRDDAKALHGQEEHLRIPGIAAKWPAMGEHNRLARAPILEKNLSTVLGVECRHGKLLS